MKDNREEKLFGGSSCRLTKRLNNEVVLKDVPLPGQAAKTGIFEDDLWPCIQQTYPRAKIRTFRRCNFCPMQMVKPTTETEDQVDHFVTNGLPFDSLWVPIENIVPKKNKQIFQCYKCLRLGHIASQCRLNQRCGEEGHNHTQCTKCANCSGKHQAISHDGKVIQEKLKGLNEPKNSYGVHS